VVGTRALSPNQAIVLAAVTNLLGALAGTAVATTVGKGLVDTQFVTSTTLIYALLGSTSWNVITWRFGSLPVPATPVRGLIGAAVGSSVRGTWCCGPNQ